MTTKTSKTTQITIRLPDELLVQVEAIRAQLSELALGAEVNTAAAIRLVMEHGVRSMTDRGLRTTAPIDKQRLRKRNP